MSMRWAASFVSARALQSTRLAELVAEDAEGNAAAHAAKPSMLQIDTAISAGMPHAAAFARGQAVRCHKGAKQPTTPRQLVNRGLCLLLRG